MKNPSIPTIALKLVMSKSDDLKTFNKIMCFYREVVEPVKVDN